MVASSKIVCKIPGRPSGRDNWGPNENPVPKLMKMTTENAMASENGARVEREIQEDVDNQLLKNRESDMYAASKRGDLVNIQYTGRGDGRIPRAKEAVRYHHRL